MMERHNNYQAIVASIHKNLVEFGYTTLTVDTVLESYDKTLAGERPVGIIDMMTRKQLKQNGLLPEEA
jgi:hypothetical protein